MGALCRDGLAPGAVHSVSVVELQCEPILSD